MTLPQYPDRHGLPNPEAPPMRALFEVAKNKMIDAVTVNRWRYDLAPVPEGDAITAPSYLYTELSSDYDETRNGRSGIIIHLFLPHTEVEVQPNVEPLSGRHWFVRGILLSEEVPRMEIIRLSDDGLSIIDEEGEPVPSPTSFLCAPPADGGFVNLSSPETYLAQKIRNFQIVPIIL